MDKNLAKAKILHRAESQPAPTKNPSFHSNSADQNPIGNEGSHSDNIKSQTQSTSLEVSTKQQIRPIKEIRGILKSKMKQRTFVVLFADTEKEETVPIAQMHKCYINELLDFYENHITKGPPPSKKENDNSNPPPSKKENDNSAPPPSTPKPSSS